MTILILDVHLPLPATYETSLQGVDWMITEKAPVDAAYDTRFKIWIHGYGRSEFDADILIPVVRAYRDASTGQKLADPSRLKPYVETPEQLRALKHWIEQFPRLQRRRNHE